MQRRFQFAAMALGVLAVAPRAQDGTGKADAGGGADVRERIAAHFKKTTAELTRYANLAIYGETVSATKPDAATLQTERELFKQATAARLLDTLPDEVLLLGHNLLVHDPESCPAFLAAVQDAAPQGNKQIRSAAFYATVVAGEAGEKAAVAQLDAKDAGRRAFWAGLLAQYAIHPSSVAPIERCIAAETDPHVRAHLVHALASIGVPSSGKLVQELAEHDKDDEVQAAAIYAWVEIAGFDGIAALKKLAPQGSKAKAELKQGLEYLQAETSAKSRHGREVGNDSEFVARFGDLRACPTIQWLEKAGLLGEAAVTTPAKLAAKNKKELFDRLLDSKGFGLEAVKGALFLSLEKEDEATLLRLRSETLWSPNAFSAGRLKTLALMIRHVRQDVGPGAAPVQPAK